MGRNYHRLPAMDDQRLRELCEQASKEQDSTRLMELAKEIADLVDEQRALRPKPDKSQNSAGQYSLR